jgi:diadenylate cyclase
VFNSFTDLVSHFSVSSVVDILLVMLIFFGLFYLIQGTRAVQLLRGIMLVVFLTVLASNLFHLTAFNWLIRNLIPALLVAIPVIFQPELRRALERLGRPGALIARRRVSAAQTIKTIARSASELALKRFGALIVLEGVTGLKEFIDTGVVLDAQISTDLLLTIFHKNSALHDGAVIAREDRVVAAACVLPLSDNSGLSRPLGTRHRAAVGVTEGTDAVAVVVSEETGAISIAHNGRLESCEDEDELIRALLENYHLLSRIEGRRTGLWNGNK